MAIIEAQPDVCSHFCEQKVKEEKAQGIVEFALVLPLLLVLMFGVIEVGRLIFIYSSVTTSAREAARYGSAAGELGGTTAKYRDCNGIISAATRMGSFAGVSNSDVSIFYDHGVVSDTFSTVCPPAPPVNLGDRIRVTVTAQYRPIVPLLPQFQSFPIVSTSSRSIIKEVSMRDPTGGGSVTPDVYIDETTSDDVAWEPGCTAPCDISARITIRLSSGAPYPVTVDLGLSGTATPGADYPTPSLAVTIPAGGIVAEIFIDPIADSLFETDETAVIEIVNASNANVVSTTPHTVVIKSSDPTPVVSINSFASSPGGPEDNGSGNPTTPMTVMLQLTPASGSPTTVNFQLSGSATPDVDYTADYVASVVIPANAAQQLVTITPLYDPIDEDNETVVLTLLSASGAIISSTEFAHTVTIEDNDDPPQVSFTQPTFTVGEDMNVQVQVKLSAPSSKDVTVEFTVDPSSSATEGPPGEGDYSIVTNPRLLTIPAGDLTANILLATHSDEVEEGEETVILRLTAPVNASLGVPSTHRLVISDGYIAPPTVSFVIPSQSEHEGGGPLNIDVQLSHPVAQDVILPFTPGGTATMGIEYTLNPPQSLIIPAGGTNSVITVNLIEDVIHEAPETVILTMDTPINAVLGAITTHTITLLDNDNVPAVQFSTSSMQRYEDAGTITVTVSLDRVSGEDVQVDFTHTGGTATIYPGAPPANEWDFKIATTNPVLIPAGSLYGYILMEINNDNLDEAASESIDLELSSPINATLGARTTHTTEILDDDDSAPVCPELTDMQFNVSTDPNKVTAKLTHTKPGAAPIRITLLELYWYQGQPQTYLDQISLAGIPIWAGDDTSPPVTILPAEDPWDGAPDDRLVQPGTQVNLSFDFYKWLDDSRPGSDYTLLVGFDVAECNQSTYIGKPPQ